MRVLFKILALNCAIMALNSLGMDPEMLPSLSGFPEDNGRVISRNSVLDKAIIAGDLKKVESQILWLKENRPSINGVNAPNRKEQWLAYDKAVEKYYEYQEAIDTKHPSYRMLAAVGFVSLSMAKIIFDLRHYMIYPPKTMEEYVKQYADISTTFCVALAALKVAGKTTGDIKNELENAKKICTALEKKYEQRS